jgi:sigma-B regulation protein RsbU (phosphoserine phosphatase)
MTDSPPKRSEDADSRAKSDLEKLNAFAVALLQQRGLDDLLWAIADNIGETLEFEDCVIYLTQGDVLVQAAAFGQKSPSQREIKSPITIPIGEGIVGTVAKTGHAEIVADTSQDPRYISDQFAGRSELTVPIVYQGDVLGILDSEAGRTHAYNDGHLELLQSVANIAASRIAFALEERERLLAEEELRLANERLEERIRDRTRELQELVARLTREVEEHQAAQRDLHAQKERAAAIFNTAIDAAMTLDDAGIVTGWNPVSERVFGWSAAEAVGRNYLDLIVPSGEREAHVTAREEYLRTGQSELMRTLMELPARHRDGREFPVEVSIAPLPRDAGGGFSTFMRDIAERTQTAEALEQAHRLASDRLSLLDHAAEALALGAVIAAPDDCLMSVNSILDQLVAPWGGADNWWAEIREAGEPPESVVCGICQKESYSGSRKAAIAAAGGQMRTFRLSYAGHSHTETGEIRGDVVLVADVTAATEAENELGALRRFPGENPHPVMRADGSGKLLFANKASLPLLSEWRVQVGAELPASIGDAVRISADTGTVRRRQTVAGDRYYELVLVPTAGANIVNLYGRDSTERRESERALEDSERRHRQVLESALDAVVTMDAHGRITEWNPQAESIFGWQRKEMLGRRMSDRIIPPSYREAHEHGLKHYLQTGEGPVLGKRIEITALRRDGSEFPIELAITAITGGGGSEDLLFSGFIRDISDQKKAEAEIGRAREQEIGLGVAIQEMFLRGKLPESCVGFDLDYTAEPSRLLDGDFAEFLPHGRGVLDIVVGDVMGKGIPAALLGAATKSQFSRCLATLMADATFGLPRPDGIVGAVHDAVTERLLHLNSFVTACYVRFDLEAQTVSFVDCGHPRIIHYHARDRTCSLLEGSSLPLGFLEAHTYRQHESSFEAGDVFVLYTDGITELRSPGGEMFGEERLRELVAEYAHRSSGDLASRIRVALDEFGGGQPLQDDVTLVVVGASPAPADEGLFRDVRLSLTRDLSELAHVRSVVADFCSRVEPRPGDGFVVELQQAVQESLTNILRHSAPSEPTSTVDLHLRRDTEGITVGLTYEGMAFQHADVELPDLSVYPTGGFGLFIIEQSVDSIRYTQEPDGRNCISLEKRWQPA